MLEPRKKSFGRAVLVIGLVVLFCSGQSCIASRGSTCSLQSDCQSQGQFCAGSGFCQAECRADVDCPCGSHCAVTCGICVRNDLLGPATCVAFQSGLSTNDVLGACSVVPPTAAADAGQGDGRLCMPQVTQPSCVTSPPVAAAGSGGSGGGEAGTVGMSEGGTPPDEQGGDAASLGGAAGSAK
jgi:hypothetical protein